MMTPKEVVGAIKFVASFYMSCHNKRDRASEHIARLPVSTAAGAEFLPAEAEHQCVYHHVMN